MPTVEKSTVPGECECEMNHIDIYLQELQCKITSFKYQLAWRDGSAVKD